MAETEVFLNPWLSPFPDYALSSTGSLRLSGLPEQQKKYPPSTVVAFEEAHRRQPSESSLRQRIAQAVSKGCSELTVKGLVKRHLPLVKTLRQYRPARDAVADLCAGMTVGVMMIPQAMAFAMVASLPPIVGMYMAFFSSLVYVFLGTGNHLSWNCVAVLAIMMANVLDSYDARLRLGLPRELNASGLTSTPTLTSSSTLTSISMNPAAAVSADRGDPWSDGRTIFSGVSEPDVTMTSLPFASFPGAGISDQDQSSATVSGLSSSSSSSSLWPLSPSAAESEVEQVISAKKLELACSVSLLSGIILAVLGKLGLGRLASFMSDSLVISFTVGVAFHVIVGQAGNALGLDLPSHSGAFRIFRLCADIAARVPDTNPVTAVVFVVCTGVIYGVKVVNERFAHKLKVPIPVELIVVVAATAVNSALKLNESYAVSIVEDVPRGLPRPRVPDVRVGLDYLSEGLVIIFVSFTQTVALGKIMALKHSYRVDPNLEMFSLGVGSVVCSLFSGFIPGASITCTVIQDSAGGRTQVASLFSSGLVLLVILFLGPYFYYLPRCVLAAVVLVNIRSLFLKLLTIPQLWRKSRADCVVWVSTCLATVVLDSDLGLVVGLAVCVTGVLLRARLRPVRVLGHVTTAADQTDLWRSVRRYHDAHQLPKVKVVGIQNDFYFVNCELIGDAIVEASGLNPTKLKRKGKVIRVDTPNVGTEVSGQVALDIPDIPDNVSDTSSSSGRGSVDEESVILSHEHIPEIRVEDVEVEENSRLYLTPGEEDDEEENHRHAIKDNGRFVFLDIPSPSTKDNGHFRPLDSSLQAKEKGQAVAAAVQCPPELPVHTLVIDFSCVSYVDLMAVGVLDVLVADFEAVGVRVFLTHLHERCVDTLRNTGFLERHSDKVFLTTAAALSFS